MQISQVQNYTNTQYNKNLTKQKFVSKNKLDCVAFTGVKPEPESLTKKLKNIIDIIKTSIQEIRTQKVEKKQTLIDSEKVRTAEEEAKHIAYLKKREETIATVRRNLEEERKLRENFEKQRIENYKKLNPDSLAKEYRRCIEENNIIWSQKIKQILKSRGYAIIDGEAVREYSHKAYRPLEILPIDDIPNSSYAARMIQNPPYFQSSDIMELPTRGNYSLDNIGIYNFNFTQSHFGQIRFPGTKFSANTGLEIPGIERGWTMAHSYRPNLRDYEKYHYCTTLSYRHDQNYLGQAPGFSFLIEGELQAKELEELKNMFIDSGLMEKLLKSEGNKEEATRIFKDMAEIIVNYLNKSN